MKKRTGKGKGIDITSQFTSTLNRFKGHIANVSEGIEVRPWRPYTVPREMAEASERAAAYCRLPSMVR